MADITKCQGFICPLKENCYRFTAESNPYRQSYMQPPYDFEKEKCESYISNSVNGATKDSPGEDSKLS